MSALQETAIGLVYQLPKKELRDAIQFMLQLMPEETKRADPYYSEANIRYLEKYAAQLNTGKIVVKTMAELEARENA